ncbi:MAG: hypothetical protein HZA80_02100 [Candidatus Taylorbacteria bacterium]|nr:hypothetical protein [Candidatus Taylorbacteria bacterium]
MNKITKFLAYAFVVAFALTATVADAAPGTVSGGSSASGGRTGSGVRSSHRNPSVISGGSSAIVTYAPGTVSGGVSVSSLTLIPGGSSASTSGAPATISGGNSAVTAGAPSTTSGGTSATNIALAPSTTAGGNSATNPASAPSTTSGGTSASTDTTTPSTPVVNPSTGSTGGRSGGGSGYSAMKITDVMISKISNTQIKVSFNTTPNAQGQLVWGTTSVKNLNGSTLYGYSNGTQFDSATFNHTAVITIVPGTTYYVRPVAKIGSGVLFGTEIALTPAVGQVISTPSARPAVGTDTSGGVEVKITLPGTEETGGVIAVATTSPVSSNTAAAAGSSFGAKIGKFFKNIWNSVTAPICR